MHIDNGPSSPVPTYLMPRPGQAGEAAAAITQGTKAVTTAGTPVKLVASTTLVESVEIHARKAPGTANTGVVYLGISASGGSNYRTLAIGEVFSMSAPDGKKINLASIYIDAATNGDGVLWTALD